MPSYFHNNCLQWKFCTLKTNFSHLFSLLIWHEKRETIGQDLIFPAFEKWKRKTRRPYFPKTFVQSPSYFPKNRLLWKFCALKTYDGHHLLPPDTLDALPTCITCLLCPNMTQIYQMWYDRVSDVVENGVRFASKILTHNRIHWHWSTIANLKANMPRIQNMYNMYRAKVDRLAGKNYFLLKTA